MYDEVSLGSKILYGLCCLTFFVVIIQHCHYNSKIKDLQLKVSSIECIKQCLQEQK